MWCITKDWAFARVSVLFFVSDVFFVGDLKPVVSSQKNLQFPRPGPQICEWIDHIGGILMGSMLPYIAAYMDPMGLFWMFFIFNIDMGHDMGWCFASSTWWVWSHRKLQEISQQRCEILMMPLVNRGHFTLVTVVWLKRWCDVYSPILFSHVNGNSAFPVLDLCS